MNIIIMGPQGSGKGTQAKRISAKYNIPHISTGDIFRENIKNGTELGKTAQEFTNRGQLVPDDLTIELIKDRLQRPDCDNGFILDGFPRNLPQGKALDTIVDVDVSLLVDVSDEEAIKRISGRRTCVACGKVFNINFDNVEKCDVCGEAIEIRDDDKPETIAKRLEVYHENTSPLIGFYEDKGIMIKVDGERAIEVIFEDIVIKLESLSE